MSNDLKRSSHTTLGTHTWFMSYVMNECLTHHILFNTPQSKFIHDSLHTLWMKSLHTRMNDSTFWMRLLHTSYSDGDYYTHSESHSDLTLRTRMEDSTTHYFIKYQQVRALWMRLLHNEITTQSHYDLEYYTLYCASHYTLLSPPQKCELVIDSHY